MFFNLRACFQRALALVALADVALSQTQTVAQSKTYDPNPFNFIGTIDSMTLNNASDPLSGGSITVNGFDITVPKNLLVTLPSITCAWSEMFDTHGTPQLPLLGSVSWEATIYGNVVGGKRIAGLVYIVQESTQLLQGFITSIDFTSGHFFIDNTEVVLNDPIGRFSHPYTDNPLWTVDPDNPSIRSSTGYPVCIPRNTTDPGCPLTNRPKDGNGFYLTAFTMPDPALVTPGGLDPRIMVPLVVGDYITYSGTKVGGGLLAIYSLEANLGIYTAPGTKPAYITCEAAQYGIVVGDPTVEIGETRATTISTDPSTTIQWFAIDVDPCTGKETERNLLLVAPDNAAPIGKSVFRLGKTDASPATRNVGFRYTNGVTQLANGLVAGQFIQPIFTYIFPELISFGAQEPPNQFDLIPYLAKGGGPLELGNLLAAPLPSPTIVGQLDPWPGAPVPAATSCPPPAASSVLASATSSSASASSSPVKPKDTVTILSATTRNQKGATMTTVTALTNSATAQLSLAIFGATNVGAQPMTSIGSGEFTLTVSTKGKPTSVTVTSSEGGSASQAV